MQNCPFTIWQVDFTPSPLLSVLVLSLQPRGSKAERKGPSEDSPACVISVVLLASEFFWKLSQAAENVIF